MSVVRLDHCDVHLLQPMYIYREYLDMYLVY